MAPINVHGPAKPCMKEIQEQCYKLGIPLERDIVGLRPTIRVPPRRHHPDGPEPGGDTVAKGSGEARPRRAAGEAFRASMVLARTTGPSPRSAAHSCSTLEILPRVLETLSCSLW